jgi:hypothetical protein
VLLGALARQLFLGHSNALAVTQAQALLEKGDPEGAVGLVTAKVNGAIGDPALIAVGVAAEEELLDRHAHTEDAAATLAWAHTEIQVHPWAAAMQGRLPQIEIYAVAIHLNDHPEDWDQLDALLAKYPKDPALPYTAASILEQHGMPQDELPYYEMALERGGYPGDRHIRELCEATFSDFSTRTRWSPLALRIEKKWYPAERLLWAEKHLDLGSANEYLNAWQILHEEKRPEPEDALHRDLHDFLEGGKDASLRDRLLAERSPAARERIASLVGSGLTHGTFDIGEEDRIQAFLDALKKS